MSLSKLSKEEIKQRSMLEITTFVLAKEKKALSFQEIYNEVTAMKGLTAAQKENYIAQFYTELNVDGRFMTLGENVWGLKEWYPVDQQEEEVTSGSKKKKDKVREEPVLAEDGFDAIVTDEDLELEELDEDVDEDEEEEEEIEDDLAVVDEDLDDDEIDEVDEVDEELDEDLDEDFDEEEEK